MKFGVVIFPGSNCDQDMIYVLGSIMKQEVVELWHKDTDLKGVDVVVLPGGFLTVIICAPVPLLVLRQLWEK